MNQILFTDKNKISKNQRKKIRKFKFLFCFSVFFAVCYFLYYIYGNYINSKNEKFSDSILNTFNIQRLYSSDSNDTVNIPLNNDSNFFVIGSIEIPSIKINYPILSNATDDFLRLAPCRFYGPYPNKAGNLCIAGHNYDDDRFFSNLYKLNIGDTVNIYDATGYLVTYYVFDKYEIDKNDTSCTLQNTNGKKEITLVTCNNFNGNRLIVKAKE